MTLDSPKAKQFSNDQPGSDSDRLFTSDVVLFISLPPCLNQGENVTACAAEFLLQLVDQAMLCITLSALIQSLGQHTPQGRKTKVKLYKEEQNDQFAALVTTQKVITCLLVPVIRRANDSRLVVASWWCAWKW